MIKAPAQRNDLPEFGQPPVVETALGVEFEPIRDWTLLHYGRFWERVRAEYPGGSVQPPIVTPEPGSIVRVERIDQMMPIRAWFANETNGRLIQLQSDRFVHNWRRFATGGEHPYPRYPETRQMFAAAWQQFLSFLDEQGLPSPVVKRCEVTYINHIERGAGWSAMSDLASVTNLWCGTESLRFLPTPEAADMDIHFAMPGIKDRLHVQFRRAARQSDGAELIQLALTARGVPQESGTDAILAWFDVGREWVVRGFTDITTEKMHRLWGRSR